MNQFVESLRRLYVCGKVNEKKVADLYKNGKITEIEKNYILNVN